jgi:6-phosphogluconolactonase
MTLDDRWTRRDFLSAAAVGAAGLAGVTRSRKSVAERLAYIGTYTADGRSEGIYRLLVDTTTGAMRLDGTAATAANPSYLALHPNGRVLYAVNELASFRGEEAGGVSAFAVERASGRLSLINQESSHGKSPCYVSVDRAGRVVFVANYGGGSITSIPLRRDGGLQTPKSVVRHEGSSAHPVRQTAPHAHCILPDPTNRYVLAVDLGTDAILTYRLDERTGGITIVTPGAATKPGAGPRHLTFHPNGRYAYVVNELDATLGVFTYDAERGALDEVQVTPASPGGTDANNHPADIHVAASGRFLYASNRGDDTIAVFAIDAATGQVTPVHQVSSGGVAPRNFALDPSGHFLLAANQRSDLIVSFRVAGETGRLTPTGATVQIPTPVCIRFRS